MCVVDPAGGGGGGGAKSHDRQNRKKAWSSIHHLILSGLYGLTVKYELYYAESKIILSFSVINRVFTDFDGMGIADIDTRDPALGAPGH